MENVIENVIENVSVILWILKEIVKKILEVILVGILIVMFIINVKCIMVEVKEKMVEKENISVSEKIERSYDKNVSM